MFCHLGHFFFLSWRVCYLKGRSLRCSLGRGNTGRYAVRGGGAEREQWRPLHSPLDFSYSLCYPQSNWAPLVLVPEWVGLCTLSAPVGLSNDLSCEAGTFSCCRPNPHGCFHSKVWGLFPRARALGYVVCFDPPPFLLVYLCTNVGPQGLLVVRLPAPFIPHSSSLGPATATRVLSAPAARLRPSYRSGWMFIFYLLGVGLPCPTIFCQFWLGKEAQCVYLCRHLGSPIKSFQNRKHRYIFWKQFTCEDRLIHSFSNYKRERKARNIVIYFFEGKSWNTKKINILILY